MSDATGIAGAIRRGLIVFACTCALGGWREATPVATARMDYRVVFASARQLARQLDTVGREGYACVAVAQPEPGAGVPGVVVILGRTVGGSSAPVSHRVITAAGSGVDLQAPLDRAGLDGFRLCGVILDEEPPRPVLVAIASRATDGSAPIAHYGVEVLTNYKSSLQRLGASARDGYRPVAASPIDNNRVPDMRTWLIVMEQVGEKAAPREIAVRSNSGPEGLQRALNEQARDGYEVDLIWKEGHDTVAMMSRPLGIKRTTLGYTVDVIGLARVHSLAHRYLADVPALAADERLVISDRAVDASQDVEEDALPRIGPLGYADPGAMGTAGDHISRHHGFAPASAKIHRGQNGTFVLTTILSQRSE